MSGANKEKEKKEKEKEKKRKSDPSVIFSSPFQLLMSGGQKLRKAKNYCVSLAPLGTETHL